MPHHGALELIGCGFLAGKLHVQVSAGKSASHAAMPRRRSFRLFNPAVLVSSRKNAHSHVPSSPVSLRTRASGMRPHSLLPLAVLQLWSSWPYLAQAQAQQTFFPAAVPLAVRSPTFSAWLDTRNGSNPMATWPQFWNDQHTLGWAGYIKVDGVTFRWLGDGIGTGGTWLGTQVTPTRTILSVQAGPMLLNVTFLSPVEPSDWTRQSFPFSYVYIDGTATDGKFHLIQLYSDISAEWATNSLGTSIQWATGTTSNTVYHQVKSSTPNSVFGDVAEDSTVYYAIAANQPGRVSVIGNDVTLRPQFAAAAGLTLIPDLASAFGNVRDASGKFPVFAHALDLGQTNAISSVAWAVGLVRDPVVTFNGAARRSYFWAQYATIGDAIDAFVADFPAARARAIALDQQIMKDATAAGAQAYADLVALATRQAMAGVELTVSLTPGGQANASDVQAFMKDVGNSQRVNPTEAIYAALPALMYLNSSLTGLLLEPLLSFQSSPVYSNAFAAPDLGTFYSGAPGNTGSQEVYGVENSGNMLILVLAHASSSGDGALIARYYDTLKGWADYLIANALIPGQQLSADALNPNLAQNHGNTTNLAIKGIIAIQAMSEMSQIKGQTADAQKYASAATSLAQSWINLTSASGSLRWTYGDDSSFGLMYNLFADRLLKLNVVPASIYTAESSSLTKSASKAQQPFGFPLSSDSNSFARSDWALFSAAAAPDASTANLLITSVHQRATDNLTAAAGPFSNVYNAATGAGIAAGKPPNGFATPAQGAMFSLLSLNVPNKTITIPSSAAASPSPSGRPESRTNTGAIAGGVIAGLALLLLLGIVGLFLRRRRRTAKEALAAPQPYHSVPTMAAYAPPGDLMLRGPDPYHTESHGDVPSTTLDQASRPQGRSSSPFPPARPVGSSKHELVGHIRTESDSAGSQPVSVNPPSSVSRGTADLRSEMEHLRREVEELRAAHGIPQEAPPDYQ
ncbi:hypothetical protein B0H15DRAFT_295949 [Mycena belliarum]|uniref:DUF1793-domain-containing protein n=1 Tax=Mycena belliarum TaxID=1033014 RepID=A0AAD6XLU8_9AGAR|nr:hypothetical protein B0H15DRAFT_295949 [Mycena belliae]